MLQTGFVIHTAFRVKNIIFSAQDANVVHDYIGPDMVLAAIMADLKRPGPCKAEGFMTAWDPRGCT